MYTRPYGACIGPSPGPAAHSARVTAPTSRIVCSTRPSCRPLIEIGRAKLPSLAPEWTDHNAHDPGITLMELLAYTAEAQLYSLSRLRRDERVFRLSRIGDLRPVGGWPRFNKRRKPKKSDAHEPPTPAKTEKTGQMSLLQDGEKDD